jgi:DNA recombination protein RmuC
MENLIYIVAGLSVVNLVVLLILWSKSRAKENDNIKPEIKEINSYLARIESGLREDFRINREENANIAGENRKELNNTLKDFSLEMRAKFDEIRKENRSDSALMREEMSKSLKEFQVAFDKNVESFNNLQREKFAALEEKQNKLVEGTEKKLEEMRLTVDEKLQKTLNERLSQSFELVGKQLESVQKGLGEMQSLAQDVGGLKKVLSNVKTRGGFGEVQLSMLLEQILAPDQYEKNVKIKPDKSESVEFAIKLPGKDDLNSVVWLAIDAKFPSEVYEHLQDAYESGDVDLIAKMRKNLENTIKKMAKDIHDKYINPPYTTDFAILFLPFEGIYAEVINQAGLLDNLQRQFKIVVTGPTTLAAILNSLQMGFRTLAIQKRSSEVWKVLSEVKSEFDKFGGMMEKAQNSIQSGLNHLDEVMGRRTRAIQRRLKNVTALEESTDIKPIPENLDINSDDEDE